LPALQQTLEELQKDFETPPSLTPSSNPADEKQVRSVPDQSVFLKAVVNGKIIGSVRGCAMGETAQINRLIVHPYFQRRGIGQRLMAEIEQAFPKVKRFEVFTGSRSERSLKQFRKLGYQQFKTEPSTPALAWVYMQKERS
jgi:ribosomal protein S18 acetylase RimI-like enzyme